LTHPFPNFQQFAHIAGLKLNCILLLFIEGVLEFLLFLFFSFIWVHIKMNWIDIYESDFLTSIACSCAICFSYFDLSLVVPWVVVRRVSSILSSIHLILILLLFWPWLWTHNLTKKIFVSMAPKSAPEILKLLF
jgi:hypothetical protein